jgi:SAM-dependent methyltransferase
MVAEPSRLDPAAGAGHDRSDAVSREPRRRLATWILIVVSRLPINTEDCDGDSQKESDARMHANGETRTSEQVRDHYEIEKELANRLRSASRDERLKLYGSVYNELFQRVPLHPQLTKKADPRAFNWAIDRQLRVIDPFLRPDATFLEVGAGDCALSVCVSLRVRKVYAIDVSDEIMSKKLPGNVEGRISDGITIPVPKASVDVAYSNQVIEHLHPDDTLEQLTHIYDSLAPGGVYVCITPNRLSGPHDISKYFDEHATGFHLKEYTFRELHQRFMQVGFSRVRACVGGRGRYLGAPPLVVEGVEGALRLFSGPQRRAIANRLLVSSILGIRIIGTK